MTPLKRAALLKVLRQMGELEFLPDEIEPAEARATFTAPHDRFLHFLSSFASRFGHTEPIPFVYLARSGLNARAFRCDGHSFIGINCGSVLLLQDVFSRMLASPEVFPEIGDSAGESPPPKLAQVPIDAVDLPCRPDSPFAPAVEPRSLVRALYAKCLTRIALDFLFLHEYQHVGGGHLEFLANGRQGMSEIGPGSDAGDWVTSHVLELEADAAAANFSLNAVYMDAGNGANHPLLAPFLESDKALCQAWLFAVHTLFIIMNEASDRAFLAGRPPPITHPAAIFKRSMMANLVFARRGLFDDLDMALGAGAEMLMAAHDALGAVVAGRDKELRFGLDLFGNGDGGAQLARRWKKMRPRLQALAKSHGSISVPSDLVGMFNRGWENHSGLILSPEKIVQVNVPPTPHRAQ